MDIKIEPEQIDQFVREAVIKSAIGKAISDGITKTLSGYNNPIEEQVRNFVAQIARQIIEAEHRPAVEEAVRKVLIEKVTGDLVGNIASKICEKLTSNSY